MHRVIAKSAALVAFLLLPGGPSARCDERAAELEPIQPIPLAVDLDPRKVELGERLFNDRRLSADDTVSCAACHDLARGGVDRTPHSVGIGGQEGKVNAPTVFNSGFNLFQFWDGRAETLEEQAAGPVHNPIEMGSDWPHVLAKLDRDADYRSRFAAIYGGPASGARIADAIATFERSLTTPDGPFDRYLRGDARAISPQAQEGYRLFKSYGCVACHQGINVGGNLFQTMGTMGDFFGERGRPVDEVDLGRYNVTHRDEDRFHFKVPSLRLAVLTPPYFHDGSVARLDEAIRIMGRYQLGRLLDDDKVEKIVAFLETLPGQYRGKELARP